MDNIEEAIKLLKQNGYFVVKNHRVRTYRVDSMVSKHEVIAMGRQKTMNEMEKELRGKLANSLPFIIESIGDKRFSAVISVFNDPE